MHSIRAVFLIAMVQLMALLPGLTLPSNAHRVNVYAWPENEMIHVEAKFSNGKPAMNTPLEVYTDPGGDLLLKANTDQQGVFEFPLPETVKNAKDIGIKVVLIASMGHRDEWLVTPQDIDSLRANASHGVTYSDAAPPAPSSEQQQNPPPPVKETPYDEQVIKQIVEEALDKKLAPLVRQVSRGQERISLREILGGMGYIVGIMGFVLAVRAGRKRT